MHCKSILVYMVDLSILDKSFCELPSGFIWRERVEGVVANEHVIHPFIVKT